MNRKKNDTGRIYNVLYAVILTIIVVLAIVLILTTSSQRSVPFRVGCVFNGGITDAGWNSANYLGVKAACSSDLIELSVRENVPEEEMPCISAVNSLVAEGCKVVFLVSYGYETFADKLISLNPDVMFCVTGSETKNDDLSYYLGRIYEGRYLAGVIAGLTTKTDTLGYVAAMPNNEVNRGINAFLLGARSVNANARVKVIFTGSWDDPVKEKSAVKTLSELSADVIAYHQDQEDVPEACDELGIDFIGCYEMRGKYSDHFLTSISCSWDRIYGKIIRDVLNHKKDKDGIYWLGVSDEAVGLSDYSQNVPVRARYEASFALDKIKSGLNVFSGEIYDNAGTLRCAGDEAIGDNSLIFNMDWYAEGVELCEEK